MTGSQREELIRAYLEGRMSLQQEHDFFIDVALDKDLRHELKAQQTIESAFRKDSAVDPSEITRLQREVSAMLVASRSGTGDAVGAATRIAPSALVRVRRMLLLLGGAAMIGALGLLPGDNGAPVENPSSIPSETVRSVEPVPFGSEAPPTLPGSAASGTAEETIPATVEDRSSQSKPTRSAPAVPTHSDEPTAADRRDPDPVSSHGNEVTPSRPDADRNDSMNVGVRVRIEPN